MTKAEKLLAFEYTLSRLHDWYKEAYTESSKNDISILKSLKLLFFISAVDANINSQNTLLDNTFNNFVAMPYGHVESDVYDGIKQGLLKFTKIDTRNSLIDDAQSLLELDYKTRQNIDISLEKLKTINFDLIKMSSFELVELSHLWYSWQKNFQKAKKSHSFSYPISIDEIKGEEKIYQF